MTTRDAVLAALREAAERGVSGEVLARAIGVSRVAVGKHVSALRDAGYEIVAEPGVGYRLITAPDAPLPSEVSRYVRTPERFTLTGGGDTDSTNDDARMLARAGADEWTVALAGSQSAGRGRMGRTWESPSGGAYLSIVLRPQVTAAEVAPLSLVVALGVAHGLDRAFGIDTSLKWPNDVLLAGRKLAGILLEMAAEADRVEWVVAGVGLNVAPFADDAALDAVACVRDAAPDARVAAVAAAVLDGISVAYDRWQAEGFSAMRADYEARSSLLGREVTVRDMTGAVKATGTAMGVDDEGRLLVATLSGVVPIAAGEVTLREPGAGIAAPER
ncbi:MAG: biotin--[acetyl-CoA-carboxylase] ligase [Coriobacteriia bacterium]|nr:biotin--[acetyl-CoA-carboxylase] ligase [Coriobacteriia bacterium]